MISISNKTKQFLVFLFKLLVVGGSFYFIYEQLAANDQLDWSKIFVLIRTNFSFGSICFLILLSILNRYFEILKWQNLVSFHQKITVAEATKQVLAALTAGFFTPNGLGEYAGKALYYNKKQAKKIVFLNLLCNGVQMAISVIAGVLGLLYFDSHHQVIGSQTLIIVLTCSAIILGILFLSKNLSIKGMSVDIFIRRLREVPKSIHQKNMFFALFRYLFFAHQYFFFYIAFGVDIPYLLIMATIATVYFLASCLPNFQFIDFAVKGSIGIFFFSILGVDQWIVAVVTTLMWLLNVVIPVIIGSYFVMNFRFNGLPTQEIVQN